MPHIDALSEMMRSSQRTLFILRGLPYAGTSYVAEEVRQHTGAISVCDIGDRHHSLIPPYVLSTTVV